MIRFVNCRRGSEGSKERHSLERPVDRPERAERADREGDETERPDWERDRRGRDREWDRRANWDKRDDRCV